MASGTISQALRAIYSSLASEENGIKGSDSCGEEFESIIEMWQSLGVSLEEHATNENWYNHAADYYEENCSETLDGVLGGFASITDVDLAGSKRFLDTVMLKRANLNWPDGAGCECGAGIGRVSKGLLLPLGVRRCDLVESSKRLLSVAPGYIGDPDASRCRYICDSLQTWEPPKDTYTIIWIQWVLVYLTDMDIIKFLTRCGEALKSDGVICLKENTCDGELFVLDKDDASVTRSVPFLLKLIEAAGLIVVHQETQVDFPEEIFAVPMIAIGKP
jgi:protein N-terminal methyltransferase